MFKRRPSKDAYETILRENNAMLRAALDVIKEHQLENEWVDKYLNRDGVRRASFRDEFEHAETVAKKIY